MPNPNKTEIVVILDRSGSMAALRDAMQQGFERLVDEHRAEPGECAFSLCQFDHKFEVMYEARPVAEVHGLQLEPRGRTALLDGLGESIRLVTDRHDKLVDAERPGGVVIVVITDGCENASKEWTREAVRAAVARSERERQWQFVFLAADLAGINDARSVGVHTTLSYGRSLAGVTTACRDVAKASVDYRARVRAGDAHSRIMLRTQQQPPRSDA